MNCATWVGFVRIVVGLGLAALLCTCTPSTDEVQARHDAVSAPSAAAIAAAKSGNAGVGSSDVDLVTAVAMSKVRLPLEVRFRLEAKPVIGQPVKIDLVVTPAPLAQIRSVQFKLEAGNGLLLQGDAELLMSAATPGIAVRYEIVVVPQTAGVLELKAHAVVETNSDSLSQIYAIPLVVQAPANPG